MWPSLWALILPDAGTVVLTSFTVPGCTNVKLLTANDTMKEELTFVLRFRGPPGDRIAMVHFAEHGTAIELAPLTRGVVEGIAVRKKASTSAMIANRLWLRIFSLVRESRLHMVDLSHSGSRSVQAWW